MKQRWITTSFALAAVVHLGEAVLCAIVWSEYNKFDRGVVVTGAAPPDLTPFPGGFTTMRVLWFAGIACALLALLLSALPLRAMLTFLAVASLRGALVRIGIWSLLIIAIWSFIVVGSSSILILNPETFTDRMGDYRTIWLFTAFALANAVIAINFARDRYHARR